MLSKLLGNFKYIDTDRLIIENEISSRNLNTMRFMAVVALPILLVVLGLFYYDLNNWSGVKYFWRKGIITMLFALVVVFSACGATAFYFKYKSNAPKRLLTPLFYSIYLLLPIVGAIITAIDQLVTSAINAYFIFCAIPSMVLLIAPKHSFVCFAISYFVLFWGLAWYQPNLDILLSNRANGLAATTLGYALSVLLWRINIIRYRQHREIVEQKKEIEAHKEKLEASYEKLSDAYAANQKFFSIISHDLRGPLNSTVELSKMLANDTSNFAEEKKDYMLQVLYTSLGKTSKLLDNLLTWARTQTESIPYHPTLLYLKDVVQESTELLQPMVTEKQITISYAIPEEIRVYADKEMSCAVVRNLVSNAIKFTRDKGKIQIEAEYTSVSGSASPFVQLCVKDTGVGMSKEKVKQLFKVGNRITSLGTRREVGTGLGLILSKEFVEKHGGKITAFSELNAGSSFCITLPSAPRESV